MNSDGIETAADIVFLVEQHEGSTQGLKMPEWITTANDCVLLREALESQIAFFEDHNPFNDEVETAYVGRWYDLASARNAYMKEVINRLKLLAKAHEYVVGWESSLE